VQRRQGEDKSRHLYDEILSRRLDALEAEFPRPYRRAVTQGLILKLSDYDQVATHSQTIMMKRSSLNGNVGTSFDVREKIVGPQGEQLLYELEIRVVYSIIAVVVCLALSQKYFDTEVKHEHDTPRHPDPTPCRRVAYLASQRELGLRPQRRPEPGRLGRGHSFADRSAVRSEPR
jgi:hypothetical protein